MRATLKRLPGASRLLHPVSLVYLVVITVWIVAGIMKPGFARIGHLCDLLERAAVIGIALVITGLVGVVNGIGVAVLRVHPLTITLAIATILRGSLLLLVGSALGRWL